MLNRIAKFLISFPAFCCPLEVNPSASRTLSCLVNLLVVLGLGLPTKDKSETLIANIVQNVYTGYDPKDESREKVTPPSFSSEPKTAKFRVSFRKAT